MVTVEEAERIVLNTIKDFGMEAIDFEQSPGRVLAEDLRTDRDLPPANRSTMDGIAIHFSSFEKGITTYKIVATQAAGDVPVNINNENECVEIMTGAALPDNTDTVIPYENISVKDGIARLIKASVTKGQSIHRKGKDKKQNAVIAGAGQVITPPLIAIAAATGKKELLVKSLPKVIIISSGNELVEVDQLPSPYQVRRSNNYMLKAALQKYGLEAAMTHLPDDLEQTKKCIAEALEEYDVLILSGGVSMGKFDYIHRALEAVGVTKLFHKVQQRPGKPFWFGEYKKERLVFAFPGNPISTFMCLHRYFLLWLQASLGLPNAEAYAILNKDFSFTPNLTCFLQVHLKNEQGRLLATPAEGNGSGDFANLVEIEAFMELPAERDNFTKGEIFKVWMFT